MAVWFPKDYFSSQEIKYFINKSTFMHKDRYGVEQKFEFYRATSKGYFFPIGLWEEMFDSRPTTRHSLIEPECDISLGIKKGVDQSTIVKEACDYLSSKGHCFLNIPTGCGKTTMSVYLACALRRKTIIVSSVSVTLDQWKEEFEKHTNLKPQYLDTKKEVVSPIVVCTPHTFKHRYQDLQDYGTIIIDEMHKCTKSICKGLLYYRPKYLIGLTATLERGDGLVNAIKTFFHESIVSRIEVKKGVTVHVIKSNFCPTPKHRFVRGKTELDYNDLVNQLCNDQERNECIVKNIFGYLSTGNVNLSL